MAFVTSKLHMQCPQASFLLHHCIRIHYTSLAFAIPPTQRATMIPPELIEKVLTRARDTASHSWEYSTVFEALLEYRNPELTIFGPDPFPNGRVPELSLYHVEALRYVLPFIRTDEVTTTLCDGNGKPLDLRSISSSFTESPPAKASALLYYTFPTT
jgi:hypothetical protein